MLALDLALLLVSGVFSDFGGASFLSMMKADVRKSGVECKADALCDMLKRRC